MRGISITIVGLAPWLAHGAVVLTKQVAADAPKILGGGTDELFPLPAGFKTEPDLDPSKKSSTPGAKVVKLRQGPFKLTPNVELLQDEQFLTEPALPCTDCWITAIQGGLEFANGTAAHVEQGAMLQHLYILSGSGRDEVCKTYNLQQPNRLYVTGNERETVRLNPDGLKYGQYLAAVDEWFALRWNAVNTGKAPLDVYLTQTYEYIPNAEAKGYKGIVTAYMDLGGCGGTWFSPQSGQYDLKSFTWKSSITGKILFVAGHVHSGGLNTKLYVNDKPICNSEQIYGRKRTSVDVTGLKHISDNGVCTNIGNLKKGDMVHITTSYDSAQHPYDTTLAANQQEAIMAINNIYIGLP